MEGVWVWMQTRDLEWHRASVMMGGLWTWNIWELRSRGCLSCFRLLRSCTSSRGIYKRRPLEENRPVDKPCAFASEALQVNNLLYTSHFGLDLSLRTTPVFALRDKHSSAETHANQAPSCLLTLEACQTTGDFKQARL